MPLPVLRPAAATPAVLALLLALGGPVAAQADKRAGTSIFTCQDGRGRTLTSDRPIPECADREQRVLNRDGSLQRVLPPSYTPQERAAVEARERARQAEAEARRDAARRDRNLLVRYPDEASHQRAREAALASLDAAESAAVARIATLEKERQPLLAETEFYPGKPLPAKLRRALADNDAALQAQRNAAAVQRAERERIQGVYDAELGYLRRLWAGALPGSLGGLPASAAASRP